MMAGARYHRDVPLPLKVPAADAKAKDPPPLLLIAAAFFVVAVSAAVPAALFVQAKGEQRAAGDPDAGANAAMSPEPMVPSMITSTVTPGVASATPPSAATSNTSNTSTPSATTSAAAATASSVPSAAPRASASASAKAASVEGDGPGFLTISSVPPGRVSEHGRVLCTNTPCAKLPLSPGAHTITLENKEDALKTVIVVTIASGETTSRRVTLR